MQLTSAANLSEADELRYNMWRRLADASMTSVVKLASKNTDRKLLGSLTAIYAKRLMTVLVIMLKRPSSKRSTASFRLLHISVVDSRLLAKQKKPFCLRLQSRCWACWCRIPFAAELLLQQTNHTHRCSTQTAASANRRRDPQLIKNANGHPSNCPRRPSRN